MQEQDTRKLFTLFTKGFKELGIEFPDESINALVLYARELIKWNRKVNLIAKNTPIVDIVEKHFLDSLTLLSVLQSQATPHSHLLDVGSGAGFPGLVIKIVNPARPVTLLEPRQRRVTFLNHVIRTLQLAEIEVIPKRTDELVSSSHPHYGIITARAVADVATFLDMVKELAPAGTLVICLQGASGPEQWERAQTNQNYSGKALVQTTLPFSGASRSILVFRKQ